MEYGRTYLTLAHASRSTLIQVQAHIGPYRAPTVTLRPSHSARPKLTPAHAGPLVHRLMLIHRPTITHMLTCRLILTHMCIVNMGP